MYSTKNNLLELVALLKEHGIRDMVLSPGSRNAPLIHSLAADPFFKCYRVVDERSAGFFALGIINATGRPAAVCCTSGTAVLNLGPAVAEAYYQQLPLVVLSADHTPAWINQMDGQTLPQYGVFGSLVRKSIQVPEFKTAEDQWQGNREINEALCACQVMGCGPVHINIPLAEPLYDFSAEKLPKVRVFKVHQPELPVIQHIDISHYRRILLIVGQTAVGNQLRQLVESTGLTSRILIFSEHLGMPRTKDVIGSFDVLLRSQKESDSLLPDLVITVGGHVVSKILKKWIRNSALTDHWHVGQSDNYPDIFKRSNIYYRADCISFIKSLIESLKSIQIDSDWLADWKKLNESVPAFIPGNQLSDLTAVHSFVSQLPSKSLVFSGNSSSIRNLQYFRLPEETVVYCHRGVNGIEGTLSSACGLAASVQQNVFVLVGDLSFFYDLNALTISPFPDNLRIVLINNKGGGIFRQLNGLEQSTPVKEFVTANHDLQAEQWVKAAGIVYLSARTTDECRHAFSVLTSSESTKATVLEIFTDENATANDFDNYLNLINKNIHHV